jgi:O-antigen ligase
VRIPVSTPGAAVLALAAPVLFLHTDLQPSLTVDLGSSDATLYLADVAVLAVAAAALVEGRRRGFKPLRASWLVLAATVAFLAAIVVGTIAPALGGDDYPLLENLLTAAKFGEYALLVPAVPLLLRTRRDVEVLFAVLIFWAALAAAVAVLQFFGVVREWSGYRPGDREPSFVGHHDLAALSAAVLSLCLGAIVFGLGGRVRAVAAAGGAVGLVLSGALAGLIGTLAAAATALAVAVRRGTLTARRTLAVVGILAVVTSGVIALRAANIGAFLRFIGVEPARETETFGGESYVQRLALMYIGGRVFLDHPLGVGWQATAEESVYGPYVDDARRRFPKVPERSLPSPEHPWGVQNAYLQAAAELGVVGLVLFLAVFASAFAAALPSARAAPLDSASVALAALMWLLVTMGVWLGLGLVAGIPLVALMWISAGLAATSAAWRERV